LRSVYVVAAEVSIGAAPSVVNGEVMGGKVVI
jgi:hypothetical protein